MTLQHEWFRTANMVEVKAWLAECGHPVTRKQLAVFHKDGLAVVFMPAQDIAAEVARFNTIEGVTATEAQFDFHFARLREQSAQTV